MQSSRCRSGDAPANAVTRRSHTRIFVRAADRIETARPRSATSGCHSVMPVPRRRGMSRLRAGSFYHPAVTVACEDSAFACRSTAWGKHDAKRRGKFQPTLAEWCRDRSLHGRERPRFSSCACRRRRRELLAPRILREPRSGAPATGMVAHVDLLSYQRVCRGQCRRRPRVRDR